MVSTRKSNVRLLHIRFLTHSVWITTKSNVVLVSCFNNFSPSILSIWKLCPSFFSFQSYWNFPFLLLFTYWFVLKEFVFFILIMLLMFFFFFLTHVLVIFIAVFQSKVWSLSYSYFFFSLFLAYPIPMHFSFNVYHYHGWNEAFELDTVVVTTKDKRGEF